MPRQERDHVQSIERDRLGEGIFLRAICPLRRRLEAFDDCGRIAREHGDRREGDVGGPEVAGIGVGRHRAANPNGTADLRTDDHVVPADELHQIGGRLVVVDRQAASQNLDDRVELRLVDTRDRVGDPGAWLVDRGGAVVAKLRDDDQPADQRHERSRGRQVPATAAAHGDHLGSGAVAGFGASDDVVPLVRGVDGVERFEAETVGLIGRAHDWSSPSRISRARAVARCSLTRNVPAGMPSTGASSRGFQPPT